MSRPRHDAAMTDEDAGNLRQQSRQGPIGRYTGLLSRGTVTRIGMPGAVMLLVGVGGAVTECWLFIRRGDLSLVGIGSTDMRVHGDFDTFWRSARALLNGTDIYSTAAQNPNLDPPLLTFLMAPLGLFSPMSSYRLFVLVTVVLVVGTMLAISTELRLRGGMTSATTIAALLSAPVLATLRLGQIYGLLMAGLAAAWIAGRREHPLLEGMALGLVVAIKPSLAPALLLPILRRLWLTFGAAMATGAVATLVGALAAGPASFFEWLRLILGLPVQTYFVNASLPGTLLRLTSVNQWSRPLVKLPGGLQIGVALGVAAVAATAWVIRKPSRQGVPDPAVWALVAASLLASPLSWHTYLVLLMPGLLVLLSLGRWPAVLLALGLSSIGEEWPSLWSSALPLSLYCGILLAYWVMLLLATRPVVGSDCRVQSPRPGQKVGPITSAAAPASHRRTEEHGSSPSV